MSGSTSFPPGLDDDGQGRGLQFFPQGQVLRLRVGLLRHLGEAVSVLQHLGGLGSLQLLQLMDLGGRGGLALYLGAGHLGVFEDFSLPGLDFSLPGLDFSLPGLDFSLPGLDLSLPGLDFNLPGLDFSLPGLDFSLPGLNFSHPGLDLLFIKLCFLRELVVTLL